MTSVIVRTVCSAAARVSGTSCAISAASPSACFSGKVPVNCPAAVELFEDVMVAVAADARSRQVNCHSKRCSEPRSIATNVSAYAEDM